MKAIEIEKDEKKIEVRETKKYGKGVFASRAIKKGELIRIFGGEIITFEEDVERVLAGDESVDDPLQIDDRKFLILDELSRTFNHSCDPNAGMRKNNELFALRDINTGEEITYDYSAVVPPTITKSMWEMKCECSSFNCRKILGNIKTIPLQQLESYMLNGAIQNFLRRILLMSDCELKNYMKANDFEKYIEEQMKLKNIKN